MDDKISIGDWVHLKTGDKYFIGYVTGSYQSLLTGEIVYELEITQINNKPVYDTQMKVYQDGNIKKFAYPRLHKEDIPDLIDQSLLTHDKKWFHKLVKHHESWKITK